MVRTKNVPRKLPESSSSVLSIVGKLIEYCAVEQYQKMVVKKCHTCELAMNKVGERRPGICCKECKDEHCNKCAGLTVELCEMMRSMEKGLWICKECESKNADMKAVLESVKSIKAELSTIKEGQAEVVEAVVKRLERVEEVQEKQEAQIVTHEAAIKQNTKKVEEGDKRIIETETRTSAIEQRLDRMDENAVSVKQTNSIIRELQNIEKAERNFVIANLPESSKEEAQERKKDDEKKIHEVLVALKMDEFRPLNVVRVGSNGRFPKKLLVIMRTKRECEQILQSAEETSLPDNIWISRDRTWNQREEARLFREEKEKEENSEKMEASQRGRPRGRPKKASVGSVRGRGSDSRKRRFSGEEEEVKWRRMDSYGTGRGGGGGGRGWGGEKGGGGKGGGKGSGGKKGAGKGARGGNTGSKTAENDTSRNSQTATPSPSQTPRTRETMTPEAQLQSAADRLGTPLPSTSNATLEAAGGPAQIF